MDRSERSNYTKIKNNHRTRNWRFSESHSDSSNDQEAINQGHEGGSVIAVLLNTDASTISKDTDLVEDGSDNQLILGNLRDAVGGP